MNRWASVLVVWFGLVALGCESQYEVRGFVYGADVEQGFVEVVKDTEPPPADATPLENAAVGLQVYLITGKLAEDLPPYEYYTNSEGEFRFELPETLLDMPGRLIIGAKTRYRITCQRVGYEDLAADVELPLDHKRHLRIFLKKIPPAPAKPPSQP